MVANRRSSRTLNSKDENSIEGETLGASEAYAMETSVPVVRGGSKAEETLCGSSMLRTEQPELRGPGAKKSSRPKPKTNYVRQNKLRPAFMGNTHSVDSRKVNMPPNSPAQQSTTLKIDIDQKLARPIKFGNDFDNCALKARNNAYLLSVQNAS